MNKRFSNRWQMAVALTIQDNPNLLPVRHGAVHQPDAGIGSSRKGVSTISKYLFKAQGSYTLPLGHQRSRRTSTGTRGPRGRSRSTDRARFRRDDRHDHVQHTAVPAPLTSSASIQSSCWTSACRRRSSSASGKNRVKLMMDGFNMLNSNTIQSFNSNNSSLRHVQAAGDHRGAARVPVRGERQLLGL